MLQQIFKTADIPVVEMERMGLLRNGKFHLSEQDLQALLSGGRTGLLKLENFQVAGLDVQEMEVKLSLKQTETGAIELLYHPIYRVAVPPSYLTDTEAIALEKGKLIKLEKNIFDEEGDLQDILIEYDGETHEFIVTDTERIVVPDLMNNETLSPEQKMRYRTGKEVELSDGTKFQFSHTATQGIRSNRLALVASIIVDGGLSYILYQGLKGLEGQNQQQLTDSSPGYHHALEAMQTQSKNDHGFQQSVYSR